MYGHLQLISCKYKHANNMLRIIFRQFRRWSGYAAINVLGGQALRAARANPVDKLRAIS